MKAPSGAESGQGVFLFRRFLKAVWRFILEAVGENDYGRYRARALARGETPLEERAFYLAKVEEKYSRPNRCC